MSPSSMQQLLLIDHMCELNKDPTPLLFWFMHVPLSGSTDSKHSFLNHLYTSCLLFNSLVVVHIAVMAVMMRSCGINAAQV